MNQVCGGTEATDREGLNVGVTTKFMRQLLWDIPSPQIYWRKSVFKWRGRPGPTIYAAGETESANKWILFRGGSPLSRITEGPTLDGKEGIPRAVIITQRARWESNNDECECVERSFCFGSSKVEQRKHQRLMSYPNFATNEVHSFIFL